MALDWTSSALDIPLNDPAEYVLLCAVATIDVDINADDIAILYDGDDEDDRDFDVDSDNELSWYMPVVDLMSGLLDDDEPMLSPILTVFVIITGALIDFEEDEEEDFMDGWVGTDESRVYRPMFVTILGQILIPMFFIVIRPTVNLLASSLTASLVIMLYETIQSVLAIKFHVVWILLGVGFCSLTMFVKGVIAILQNYFLNMFTGDD